MIGDQVVPAVGVMRARVSEVFRQAAQSRIIISAHRINQGSIPDLSPPSTASDFYFVQADEPETAVPRIIELVETRIPRRFGLDSIRNVQVLRPTSRSGVGARSLNIELQQTLNPAGDRKVERFGWTFAADDYDEEIYNGDIGYIETLTLPLANLPSASTAERSTTRSVNSTRSFLPMRWPSTRARVPNIRLSLFLS